MMIISVPIYQMQIRPMVTPTYDFGTVSVLDHPMAFHDFVYTNGGTADVVINRLQPSCHCTSGMVLPNTRTTLPLSTVGQTLPVTVPVGGSVKIRMLIDLTEEPSGPVTKTLGLYVQGQDQMIAMYMLNGEVTPDVTLTPHILDFGSINPDKPAGIKVSVTLDKRLSPTGFPELTSNDPDVVIVPSTITASTHPGPPGEPPVKALSRTYMVSPAANMPLGDIRAVLTLTPTTSDPAYAATEFRSSEADVTGTVLGDVHAQPISVFFGTIIYGQGSEQEITLNSLSLAALTNIKAVSKSPYIMVTPSAVDAVTSSTPASAPTETHHVFLQIKVNPKTPSGVFNSEINVTLGDGHRLLIPVDGYVAMLVQ